jgi:limonene-1,2-epoxide hydrolase
MPKPQGKGKIATRSGPEMKEENIKTVEAFLHALKQKDLYDAPNDDDLNFAEPMMGNGHGADALRALVSGFFAALSDVRIIQHIADGEFVVTQWEADGVFGTIPVLEKFRVRDGKITEFYAFYDPRPIFG